MSNLEIASIFARTPYCDSCIFNNTSDDCLNNDCSEGIIKWLESEVEDDDE